MREAILLVLAICFVVVPALAAGVGFLAAILPGGEVDDE